MGFPKALLSLNDVPLVLYSLSKFLTFQSKKLFVTLPPKLLLDEKLKYELDMLNAKIIHNVHVQLGYAGSIKSVLQYCSDSDGLFICPVDAPIFSEQLLIAMVNHAHAFLGEPIIIVPHFFLDPGHPVYISKHFYDFFTKEKGNLRELCQSHPRFVHALFWPDKKILLNINTKEIAPFLGASQRHHRF